MPRMAQLRVTPAPQKLDPGLSANRTWWKFWKLDHGSWPPRSNTTSSTSSPGTSSSRPSRELVFWGFRLLAWGGSVRIFSRPGSGGSLSLNGGWLLFLVDTFGVWMFGDWWPAVATTFCSFLLALVAGLSAIVLHACSLAWRCRRFARHEPQVELQETPEARGYQRLVLNRTRWGARSRHGLLST